MEDLDQIKRAVSARPVYEPLGTDPLPHDVIDLEKMVSETPKIAPLFIRVDKYKQILSNINELRVSINKLMDMLAIRKEIHRMNFETDDRLEKALQKISSSTSNFSNEFVKLRGMDHFKEPAKKTPADGAISKIGEEVMRLKQELESLEI
jgi:hypothetical protein